MINFKNSPKDEIPTFSCEGRFFELSNWQDNYCKKCLFIDSTIKLEQDEADQFTFYIAIENDSYTGEQEEIEHTFYTLDSSIELTRYIVRDGEDVGYGFKWWNSEEGGDFNSKINAFEFFYE